MTTLVSSFEGGTTGTAITTGNSGGGSGNAFNTVSTGSGAACTYDNTHGGAHGSLSALVTTGATAAASYVQWSTSLGINVTVWFRQYLYFASLPSSTCNLLMTTDSSSIVCAFLNINTTGHISVNNSASSTIHTLSTAVPAGQWVRIEGFITGDPAVGQVSLQLYTNPDSTVPVESYTSSAAQATTGPIAHTSFGTYFTASNVDYWMDDVGVSSGGPLGPVIVPSYVPDLLPAPPGFLSPSAFPFPAGPFGLPNDAPPPSAPYVIGSINANAPLTINVVRPTNYGDTIVVVWGMTSGVAAVSSVTDTKGNTYSTYPVVTNAQAGQSVAVNTIPLTTSDTITITYGVSTTGRAVIAIAIPAAAVGASGNGYAVPDLATYHSAGSLTNSMTFSTVASGASVEPMVFVAVATYTASNGPLNWPTPWIPFMTVPVGSGAGFIISVAWTTITSLSSPALPRLQLFFANSGNMAGLMLGYVAETRFAAQPGLLAGPPQAPGFLAPGSAPDVPPQLPSAVSDAPPVTPVPYLIGTMNDNGTNTSRVIPVTATTNPGDAVAVFCTAGIGSTVPLVATDTQGNSYSLFSRFTSANQAVSVAQNTTRLIAGADSITVNWTAGHPQLAIAVGIPAGAVGGSGEEWLTYDLFGQTGSSTVPSITLSTPTGAPGVPEVILAFSATSAPTNGPAAFGQDFTVLGNTSWQAPTAYTGAVAYKVASSGIAAGSVVAWTQQGVPNAGAGLMYLTFRLETRITPNQPLPLMPPGMQSPGAWQNTPFELPNDAPPTTPQPYLTGTAYTNGTVASLIIPVTTATGRGDAIVVFSSQGAGSGIPASCTDTQGNAYSTYSKNFFSDNAVFIAQNAVPLTPANGDSITVTWSSGHSLLAIAVGVPAGAAGGSGEEWLTSDLFGFAGSTAGGSLSAPALPASGAPGVPEVVLAFSTVSYLADGTAAFGQDFTVIGNTTWTAVTGFTGAVAYKIAPRGIAPNSTVVWTQQGPGGTLAGLTYVTLRLETRVASQPGLMSGLASPPGFIAPAASPDIIPFTPGVVNEPATGTPQPYFAGAGSTSVTSNYAIVPVQNPTSRGDAVTVLLAVPGTFGAPVSCTDTQGNSYSLAAYESVLQPGTVAFVAQNTSPLTAADNITVTFANSDFRVRTGIVIGCPAGAVATAPGGTWLTYTAASTGASNGGTIQATTPAPVSGPAAALAVVSCAVPNSFPLIQQGWTVLWAGSPVGGYATVVAVRVASSYRTANSVVMGAQNTANGQNISAAFVILQPETRIAPNRPVPDMPPGMLSPGAWQYTPMARATGSLAQVVTPLVLAGTGSLSAGGSIGLPGAAALNGLGALLAAGHKSVPGGAAFSGSGTTAASGRRGVPGSAVLTGTGTFAAAGAKRVPGAVLLSGTGTLFPAAQIARLGTAVLSAPGTVTVTATRGAVAFAAFSASPVLTCSYLSARVVMAANIMFPANQSGTYGASEPETTVTVPGVTDGIYT